MAFAVPVVAFEMRACRTSLWSKWHWLPERGLGAGEAAIGRWRMLVLFEMMVDDEEEEYDVMTRMKLTMMMFHPDKKKKNAMAATDANC